MAVHYQIEGRSAAQISASVESGIRDGVLAAGDALAPVRELASRLGVAPATVAAAYKELRQRGLVETAGRNGTRVRARPPLTGRARLAVPTGAMDLSGGEPDPRLLPAVGPRLRRLLASGPHDVSYRSAGAWPPLVELARARLAADGVPAAGSIMVTSGALDAIERLLNAYLRPGDRVGVEDPGWANLLDLIAALGLVAQPLPLDAEGPTVDGLTEAIRAGVAAVVVTSRAQNPTGAAVSPARAAALRTVLASAPTVLTIEDDHAAELADAPLAPLAGASGAWAFVRSVSKPYGPDLRVAVVCGDDTTIARAEGRMRLGAGWVSTLLQRLVVEMWQDPAVDTIITRARGEYTQRRIGLITALAERGVPSLGRTGINVWVPVSDELSALSALREHGWAVGPGSLHRLVSPPGLRITVSPLSMSDVEPLADAIAARAATQPIGR